MKKLGLILLAGAISIGVKEQRRFIVADVFIGGDISLLGTENSFSLATLQHLSVDRRGCLSKRHCADQH